MEGWFLCTVTAAAVVVVIGVIKFKVESSYVNFQFRNFVHISDDGARVQMALRERVRE